jgi:light-regulated signal transduction histidine kinase (bacteriophytochrome)
VTVFADLWRAQAELHEANERMRAQTEDLMRSNRDLEQFAYAASHDLQEPLRKVISFCELLSTRYRDRLDERGETYIDFAVDGARRMSALISDLLAFSRVGRTTTRQSFRPLPAADLLDHALHNLGPAIEESGARITRDPLPEVFGEATLLTAVLQNLVGNAVKFRGEEPPQVHVGVRRESDHWLFRVTDNGIGIDPAYADKIFVIFQRLHSKEAYPGTGIGLSLCRKIIEHHGGRIWLDPEVSAGAGICFTLPVAPRTVDGTDDDPAGEQGS